MLAVARYIRVHYLSCLSGLHCQIICNVLEGLHAQTREWGGIAVGLFMLLKNFMVELGQKHTGVDHAVRCFAVGLEALKQQLLILALDNPVIISNGSLTFIAPLCPRMGRRGLLLFAVCDGVF